MPMPTLPVISLIFDEEKDDCAIESPKTSAQFRRDSTKYTVDRERRTQMFKSPQQPGRPTLDATLYEYESPNEAIESKCSLKKQLKSKECQKEISFNDGKNISNAYFSAHVGEQEIQTRKSSGCVVKEISKVYQSSNHCKISNQNASVYRMQGNDIPVQHQESITGRKTTDVKPKPIKQQKERVDHDALVGIIKDQRQHILIQNKQIRLQEKQNLLQKNQIFALQLKLQELLLEKENIEKNSLVCEQTPCYMLNEPDNSTKNIRSTSKVRSAIRALKSFDCMTNSSTASNQKLKDRPTPQFGQEQDNLICKSSAKYMHSSSKAEK